MTSYIFQLLFSIIVIIMRVRFKTNMLPIWNQNYLKTKGVCGNNKNYSQTPAGIVTHFCTIYFSFFSTFLHSLLKTTILYYITIIYIYVCIYYNLKEIICKSYCVCHECHLVK